MNKELVELVVDSGEKAKLYVGVGSVIVGVVVGVGVITASYLRYKSEKERLAIIAKYKDNE